jgi:beta-glucuronidase
MPTSNVFPLVTSLPSRVQHSLNGAWKSIIDVYDVGATPNLFDPDGEPGGDPIDDMMAQMFGFPLDRNRHSEGLRAEYEFDTSPDLLVPGDWNTQIPEYHFYEGTIWYRSLFVHSPVPGYRTILHIGAANHQSRVYLNGKLLATHEGGYGPFCVELTGLFRPAGEANSLVISVNNHRETDAIPTTRTDWFNYGGILRDVTLLDVPTTFIRDMVLQLDPRDPSRLLAEVSLDGPSAAGQSVEFRIGDTAVGSLTTGADGSASGHFDTSADLARWSPERPTLHSVSVVAPTDSVTDQVGFRTVAVAGATILVNDTPTFLRGIALHDEAIGEPGRRIRTKAEAVELLGHAKALGCNFVRLAHYQHNEHTVRACDELGLLAWAEVPVYWGISWDNPATLQNGRDQLRELIVRDRNRASIILWSVANETPPKDNRTAFLQTLVGDVRLLDPTRLVSAALFAHQRGEFSHYRPGETDWVIDDPLGESLDVLAVNQYQGWYYGNFEEMSRITWSTPYDKPLLFSECGADGKSGFRGAIDESWTEDLQAEVYRHQIAMWNRIPFLAGVSPWILKDFRAPLRVLPGIQDGFNRKGVIGPNGERKLAFDVLHAFYQTRETA